MNEDSPLSSQLGGQYGVDPALDKARDLLAKHGRERAAIDLGEELICAHTRYELGYLAAEAVLRVVEQPAVLAEYQRGWREDARWRNTVHDEERTRLERHRDAETRGGR